MARRTTKLGDEHFAGLSGGEWMKAWQHLASRQRGFARWRLLIRLLIRLLVCLLGRAGLSLC